MENILLFRFSYVRKNLLSNWLYFLSLQFQTTIDQIAHFEHPFPGLEIKGQSALGATPKLDNGRH